MIKVIKNRLLLLFSVLYFIQLLNELNAHPTFIPNGNEWNAYVLYVSSSKEAILKNPSEEADTTGFVYYRDKVLIVEDGWIKFGWKKIVYPIFGYISEKNLITPEEKSNIDKRFNLADIENEYSKWTWEIISCPKNYVFVKSQMNEASETKGLLEDNEKTILIKEQFNFQNIWVKTVYPFSGYIKYYDAFDNIGSPFLALGISYGAKHIPYEKNLNNYFNPLGGYIEFGRTNWNLGFRLGYNHTESRVTTFYIKTDQIYLHLTYKIFRLFNNKLEMYALAGGNYWFSNFENKKYEGGNSYFKLEKDSGPGYVAGGGLIYNLGKFFIEAQYNIFGSRQAEFGNKPVQGTFTNYSTLYPGSNHIEIIFGYRFIL